MAEIKQACGNCRFWEKDEDSETGQGHCRRYPPVVQPMEGVTYPNSEWPHTNTEEWCGEWSMGTISASGVGLDQPVETLEMNVRAMNAFRSYGVVTLRDLVRLTENELLRYPGFGKTCLRLTKEALKARGLWLGMERPKE